MAIQLQAGLSLAESLKLASRSNDDPQMARSCDSIYRDLVEGGDLCSGLRNAGFPSLVVEMVKVGEETGHVPKMLQWTGKYYEEVFESRIETWMSLLEPTVMLILGIVVGTMMLVTLLPMVQALQRL
jgi:type II secretory pathway component PulF